MSPVAICKCFDGFQMDLNLVEQRTFANKSDIVCPTLGVTALKWVKTVETDLQVISVIQELIEYELDELEAAVETRVGAGVVHNCFLQWLSLTLINR